MENLEHITIGKATYTNKVTGETYKLGFDILEQETELSKAWDLVTLVACTKGWNGQHIKVKAGI